MFLARDQDHLLGQVAPPAFVADFDRNYRAQNPFLTRKQTALLYAVHMRGVRSRRELTKVMGTPDLVWYHTIRRLEALGLLQTWWTNDQPPQSGGRQLRPTALGQQWLDRLTGSQSE